MAHFRLTGTAFPRIAGMALLGAACLAAQVGNSQPVGILLKAGGGTLARAGVPEKNATAGDVLLAGDRLGRLNDSATLLFCPDRTLLTLAAGSEATLRADSVRVTAGKVTGRKEVGSCLLPEMVRVAVASKQVYGASLVRAESELLTAKLAAMPEPQRNAFLGEWKTAEAELLRDPGNETLKAQAASVLAKYGIPPEALNEQPALARSSAVELLRELEGEVGGDGMAAAAIAKSRETAAALYKELLFDSVAALLRPTAPVSPREESIRVLLSRGDAQSAALEAQFTRWKADRKQAFGAGSATAGLMTAFVTAASNRTPTAAQYEDVLEHALSEGAQLAAAAAWLNLGALAIQEGRPDSAPPLLELARMVWRSWNDAAGLMLADFWTGEADFAAGRFDLAHDFFEQAAEAGDGLPGMRAWRAEALTRLARVERNLKHAPQAPAMWQRAIEEWQMVAGAATDPAERATVSQKIEGLENERGDSWMALENYGEAAQAYRRASLLGVANLGYQREQAEGVLKTIAGQLETLRTSPDSELKTAKIKTFYQLADLTLDAVDGAAQGRQDDAARAEIAGRRLDLARQSGNREILLGALKGASQAYRRAGDLAAARDSIRQALAMEPERRYLFEDERGAIALEESDLSGALESYDRVLRLIQPDDARPEAKQVSPFEKLERVQTGLGAYQGRAQVFLYQGNYAQAQEEYAKLSRTIPQLYAAGAEDEAELEIWILQEYARPPQGSLLEAATRIGAIEIAAHRAQRGIAVTEAERERLRTADLIARAFRTVLAAGQANLLEWQNDLDGAAYVYEQAIGLMSNIMAGAQTTGAFSGPLAHIERQRGHYAAVEKRVTAMLEEDRRGHDPERLAATLGFSALLKLDQGRSEEARSDAEGALAVARASGLKWQTAAALQTLGKIETAAGGAAAEKAGEHLRAALTQFRELGLREHIATTLSDLGLLEENEGRDEDALASYREAAALTELLVHSLSKDVDGSVYRGGRQSRAVYDRLIRLLIRKGRGAEALRYLETAKSRSLVESLAGIQVGSSEPALASVFRRVRERQAVLREAEQAVVAEAGRPRRARAKTSADDGRRKLLEAQTAYLAAVGEVRRADPQAAALLAVHADEAKRLSRHLRAKTLLLEYFPDDEGLSIFAMTRDRAPVVYASPARKAELNRLVEEYRNGVAGKGNAAEDTVARLYNLLIAPAQQSLRGMDTLLFVPAGNLFDLPFQSLGRALPDGSMRYVIDDYAVAYLASAEQLNGGSGGKRSTPAVPMLGLGDPDGSLPGARQELSALQRIFPGGRTYTGADVTIDRLKESSAKYIHFATHATINRRDPRNSYLMLSGKTPRLSVQDVMENRYGLSFSGTRLVTLSACETSLGDEDPGATYGSLSRAFARVGVFSVVASLWQVDDAATLELMNVFYRHLARGEAEAEALRQAQLELRQSARFSNPYYWGAFVLLGQ